MKQIISVVFLIIGSLLMVGCTANLKSLKSSLQIKGKIDAKVAVFDFENLTDNKNADKWSTGVELKNIGINVADHTYEQIIKQGVFDSVTRINKLYNENEIGEYDYVITGSINTFILSDWPSPAVFVNPLSLLSVIGVPTLFGENEGRASIDVTFINAKTKRAIEQQTINAQYGPQRMWWSVWKMPSTFVEEYSETLLTIYKNNFVKQFKLYVESNVSIASIVGTDKAFENIPVRTVKSDIDNLPKASSKQNKDSYAFVIGIESYRQKLPKADFAASDARLMTEYLTKIMGYPEENVITITNENATKSDMEKYFEKWLKNNVDNNSNLFIYYSGHGAPNPKTGDAYLVPYDGDPTFIEETGYSLKRLYSNLAKLPAKSVLVALDSCFSGAGGKSLLAHGARPLVMTEAVTRPTTKKLVVLSASKGDQISSSFNEKGHGIFTYFLLKGIKQLVEEDMYAPIEVGELYDYLKPQVEKVSRRQFNNEQTPQLIMSDDSMRLLRMN